MHCDFAWPSQVGQGQYFLRHRPVPGAVIPPPTQLSPQMGLATRVSGLKVPSSSFPDPKSQGSPFLPSSQEADTPEKSSKPCTGGQG